MVGGKNGQHRYGTPDEPKLHHSQPLQYIFSVECPVSRLFVLFCVAEYHGKMSSDTEENVTSSENATPFGVTYLFHRHPVPSSDVWWPCLVCLALASVAVNLVTCLVLTSERSLQTTLYTYLTSLAVADVIGSSLVTPIMAVRTSIGQSSFRMTLLVGSFDL